MPVIRTAETQELPSLAQAAVESQVILAAPGDAGLDEALLVAQAMGIQVAPVAAGDRIPAAEGRFTVVALTAALWEGLPVAEQAAFPRMDVALLFVGEPEEKPESLPDEHVLAFVPRPVKTRVLLKQVRSAALALLERRRAFYLEQELVGRTRELRELNAIGVALSNERDHDKLLSLILQKARDLAECDAGSLYLLDEEGGERHLVFQVAQNDSLGLERLQPTPLPLSRRSLAGYVALTGQVLAIEDAYQLPEGVEYTFDRTSFDERYGYRTKSVLVVPMTNVRGDRLGVLQLINRRRRRGIARLEPARVDEEVVGFSGSLVELVLSLAGQAAIAIENNRLYREVRRLFEGFVMASVTAIEQRDPTTSGHSFRVATLTTGLADVVARCEEPRFKGIAFDADQMKEIRYAALLHDFGKVGVREEVLVKGKKLYPMHLELVKQRYAYIKAWIEAESLRRFFDHLKREGAPERAHLEENLGELTRQLKAELASVDEGLATIVASNEPTVLPEGNFEAIAKLGARTYRDLDGSMRPFLSEREVRMLSIRKGSLDEEERRQIESHVTQTFEFLSRIPWTREFSRVPEIAYAHHEKLDGRGYPRSLEAEEVPVESRMMTVADIYDALTASDRPYKKAVPVDRALSIIESERDQGMLDADLVRLFIDAKVYEVVAPGATGPTTSP